jgi:cytochrome P450
MSTEDAHSTTDDDQGRLVVRRHAAVVAVAQDPQTFSNNVSRHLHVPNGLDGEGHAAARRFLDPFFEPAEIAGLEPELRRIADELVAVLAGAGVFDAVADLGARFAVRAQSAWLGWRPDLEDALLSWVAENRAATRSRDTSLTRRVAADFDAIIGSLIRERQEQPTDDVTMRLMTTPTEEGETLTDPEVVSILRNWTGGDLSSLALCAGVVLQWIVEHPDHAAHLAAASDAELDAAIDEILRADDPFVSNRRIATRDAVVDGCPVHAGDVLVIDWRAANRDPAAFSDPDGFDPEGHAAANLVYGTGPHVCPGRGLATLELRVLVRSLLAAGRVVAAGDPERELPPVAGYRTVPVRIEPAA